MAVKRYYAKIDNTITNAFEENLTTRGTGSNMGASDILEVFSIFAQANSSSAEESRALLKFNATASTDSITADRTAGVIPASGSVSFYLRMFNAKHGQTLPKNFTMDVSAISGSWEEGTGLDMEAYKDKDESNWILADSATNTAATATITMADGDAVSPVFTQNEFVTLISVDGTEINYIVCQEAGTDVETGDVVTSGVTDVGSATATKTGVAVTVDSTGTPVTQNAFLIQLKAAIESANGHAGKITVSAVPSPAAHGNQAITLTQATLGRGGNTLITNDISQIAEANTYKFAGGQGGWATQGGDYYTDTSSSFSASFDSGVEDLEVDITTLVEQWASSSANSKTATNMGSKNDEGVGVFLSSVYSGASRSYYTKKFFARGTEFHFKKPCIEARWDSAIKDDRGTFFYSSSLATAAENLNTLYFYNYFRGQLRNIPSIGTGNIYLSIYSGSANDTEPSGSRIDLVPDGTHVRSALKTVVTGAYVSTGIYSASFAATGTLNTLYDVWHDGGTVEFQTGTIKPEILYAPTTAPDTTFASSITNLKNVYRGDETARFRVYTRQKDWSPTIYTKATAQAEVNIVESGSYEIYRVVDDLKVIPYGTGSTLHTQMSFDADGSYFDLDMEMLEKGYMYGIKLAYYNNSVGSWVEQPETFKFRVESRQSE